MAQPGLHQYQPNDEKPVIRPDLDILEGGGESTPRASGHLNTVGDEAKTVDAKAGETAAVSGPGASTAATTEKSEIGSKSNGGLFNADADDEGFLSKARRSFRGQRKKWAIGGSVAGVGVTGVVAMLSFTSGPLEFIHLAQLLTQFHFSSQEDQSDIRMGRLIRYLNDRKPERTRMGYLENKMTDRLEAKLNGIGLESQYTKTFGHTDGLLVDRNSESFKDQSSSQIRETLINEYGIPPESIQLTVNPHDPIRIDTTKMGYRATAKLNRGILKVAGYSKISSWLGARMLGARAGVTWHPIRKLDQKALKGVDAKLKAWQETRAKEVGAGTDAFAPPGDPVDDQGKPKPGTAADAAHASAVELADGGAKVAESTAAGDPGPLEGFTDSIHGKLALGGASAVGAVCMMKAVADKATEAKQSKVVLPLIRVGMAAITTAGQIMYGASDVDPDQLGYTHDLMYGKSNPKDKKKTSWSDAASIKAELGQTGGVEPDNTLKSIGKGTPFDFLQEGSFKPMVNAACGAVGQSVMVAFGLATGPFSFLAQTAFMEAFGDEILSTAGNWLSGNPVNPFAKGGGFGNNVNFGALLGANDQAIGSGGGALTKKETSAIKSASSELDREDFASQSFAYRLFNPHDARSLFSQVLDRQSPNVDQNLSNVASATLNVSHTFTGIFGSFLGGAKAHATTGTYDYGIPVYGFSEEEMQDASVTNPYKNADTATDLLEGADGPTYKDKATKCFGVNFITDSQNTIAVDSKTKSVEAYNSSYDSGDCRDSGNTKWLSIRSFISDSEVMDSFACYEGVEESCNLIGATKAAPAADNGGDDVKLGKLCAVGDIRLSESSSLAASVKHPGIVYTADDHDDETDDDKTILAINVADCSVAGKFTISGTRSGGVKENLPDIEAMQVDHTTGKIWAGDIGNGHPNQPFTTKKSKYKLTTGQPARVVVFDEPDQFSGNVSAVDPVDITYPISNQNSEALLANPKTGQGWIINKGQKAPPTNVSSPNQQSTVYKLPYPLKSGTATDTGITIPQWVTDAAFTPDGKWVLVRYRTISDPGPTSVYVYNAETWKLDGTIEVPKVEQGESITVEASGRSFLIGSEGTNSPLVRVALPQQYLPPGTVPIGSGNSGGAAGAIDLGPWKLTLPAGSCKDIAGTDLATFTSPPWYLKAADGSGQEFYVDSKKASCLTSTSSNPRSELREMKGPKLSDDKKNYAAWGSSDGQTHQLITRLKITTLSGKDGGSKKLGVVISQIHDDANDITVFRVDGTDNQNGRLYVTDGNGEGHNFGPVKVGQIITVGFKVSNGVIQYYYSPTGATSPPLVSDYNQKKSGLKNLYFKAGNYCQCSSEGGRYGQTKLVIMGLGLTHNGSLPNIGLSSGSTGLPR